MVFYSHNQDTQGHQYRNGCTLVVPGLFNIPERGNDPVKAVDQQFSDLELFLARAKCSNASIADFDTAIFDYFNFENSSVSNLPIAPVSYLGDTGNLPGGCVLRADPVYLLPNRDELILLGPKALSLTIPEAEHLAAELNQFFKDDGWHIEVVTPERWYLHVPEMPGIRTHKLSKVLDQAITSYMPDGSDGQYWRRAMNEIQMVLHSNDVNVQRQVDSQLPVNSVWLWGEGMLPEFGHSRWSQLWSSEPVSLGLARVTRTPREKLPIDAHAWLSKNNTPGQHLLVYHQLQEQMQDNYDTWKQSVDDFQKGWLNPLLQALRDGAIEQLVLNPCNGKTYQLSSGGLKRWWCRKKPVYAYSN